MCQVSKKLISVVSEYITINVDYSSITSDLESSGYGIKIFFFFLNTGSLYSWLVQKLRDSLASASQILELKTCIIKSSYKTHKEPTPPPSKQKSTYGKHTYYLPACLSLWCWGGTQSLACIRKRSATRPRPPTTCTHACSPFNSLISSTHTFTLTTSSAQLKRFQGLLVLPDSKLCLAPRYSGIPSARLPGTAPGCPFPTLPFLRRRTALTALCPTVLSSASATPTSASQLPVFQPTGDP